MFFISRSLSTDRSSYNDDSYGKSYIVERTTCMRKKEKQKSSDETRVKVGKLIQQDRKLENSEAEKVRGGVLRDALGGPSGGVLGDGGVSGGVNGDRANS